MLVTVTVCVELVPVLTLPKLTVFVLNERIWLLATPVPVNETTLGEVPALLTIVMLPLAEPATVG